MPKMKVKGSIRKRLTLTGGGRIKRKRANHSHILTKKNAKRKRRLRTTTLVDTWNEKRMKKLMGV